MHIDSANAAIQETRPTHWSRWSGESLPLRDKRFLTPERKALISKIPAKDKLFANNGFHNQDSNVSSFGVREAKHNLNGKK